MALFIKTAASIWNRPEMITIAAVKGAKDKATHAKLEKLSRLLGCRLKYSNSVRVIRSNDLFIPITYIDLSAAGKAAKLKNPWGNQWFKDDFCKGPGNIFFVAPDGAVYPCCGYANENGFIYRHNQRYTKTALPCFTNRFVVMVFGHRDPKNSKASPSFKTKDHCFFCSYLALLKLRSL